MVVISQNESATEWSGERLVVQYRVFLGHMEIGQPCGDFILTPVICIEVGESRRRGNDPFGNVGHVVVLEVLLQCPKSSTTSCAADDDAAITRLHNLSQCLHGAPREHQAAAVPKTTRRSVHYAVDVEKKDGTGHG